MHAPVSAADDNRPQSLGEEIANSISHGIGLLLALAGAPLLILAAVQTGSALSVVSVSIFALTIVLLYLSSMIYHCLPESRAKQLFLICDHIAIFLLIAGTYTPFALLVLKGTLGWTLLVVVWAAALVGTITKLIPALRYSKLSLGLYLGMGWVVLPVIYPMYLHLPWEGMLWLVAGGVAYTVGVIFFIAPARYAHFIWHLFTMTGTACHFFAVLWYVV